MKRISATLALTLAAVAALSARSTAQYIYFDTDGDGRYTAADHLDPDGWTTLNVWITTDRNRDGSPAPCSGGSGALSINSYEFILRSDSGSVHWGACTNRVPEFDVHRVAAASATEYHDGYGGATILPPGRHELATIEVSVGSGTTRLDFAATTAMSGAFGTSFGSQCEGQEADNTLKLGVDWFDTDGVGVSRGAGGADSTLATVVVNSGELYLAGNRFSPPFKLGALGSDVVVNGYRVVWPMSGITAVTPTAVDSAQHALVLAADHVYLQLRADNRSTEELNLALREFYAASPLVKSSEIDRGGVVVHFRDGRDLRVAAISPLHMPTLERPAPRVDPMRDLIEGVRSALERGLTVLIIGRGEECYMPPHYSRILSEAIRAVRAGDPLTLEQAAVLPPRLRESVQHPLRLERVR